MRSTVADVMSEPVVVVQESTPFKEIVGMLERHGVEALPVVDGAGIVVGLVAESDLVVKEEGSVGAARRLTHPARAVRESHKLHGVVARDLMTAPPITVRPDESISAAARLMTEHAVGRLPVVDAGGHPVGMVSRRDLLRVFLRPDDEIREEIVRHVLGDVLSIDAAAVPVLVDQGVVTLEGRVDHRSTITLLVDLVAAVEGVVDVVVRTQAAGDDSSHAYHGSPWGVLTPRSPSRS